MAAQTLSTRRQMLAVLAGGFLGTLSRYVVSLIIQGWFGKGWPYDILVINLTGALLLAFVHTLAEAAFLVGPTRRLLFNTGFMGAYTTFSSLALGDILLFNKGAWIPALLYIILSLVGGVCAVLLGDRLGQTVLARFHYGKMRPASPLSPLVGVSSRTNINLQDDLILADKSDGFESPIH